MMGFHNITGETTRLRLASRQGLSTTVLVLQPVGNWSEAMLWTKQTPDPQGDMSQLTCHADTPGHVHLLWKVESYSIGILRF